MEDQKLVEDSDKSMQNAFQTVWVKSEPTEEEQSFEEVQIKIEPFIDEAEIKKPISPPHRSKKDRARNLKLRHCDHCDYTTLYGNCMKIHLLNHTGEKPFKCKLCSYESKTIASLERHKVKHKIENGETLPQYKCKLCPYTTCHKSDLGIHRNKHTRTKKFKCDKCSFETLYRHSIKKHKNSHNDKDSYKCEKCNFTTKYEGHLIRHLTQIHKEYMRSMKKCEYCDFATLIKWRLNRHLISSKQENVLRCVFCDYQTVYLCQLRCHRSEHMIEAKDTVINDCSLTSQSVEENEDSEVEMPNEEKVFFYNPEKAEITWNNVPVIENNESKYFQCPICEYNSKFKASVQRHYMRLHTGKSHKPFVCSKCDFHTKTKDQISLHTKRSISSILLNCKVCNYKTYYKCQLISHQKKHNLFKCTDCEYSSKNNDDLIKHTVVHTSLIYKCEFCDYSTKRREALYTHVTCHTGVKPYKCPECDYQAARKSSIAKHVLRAHSNKEMSEEKNDT